jgi:hypothetical protein
MQTLTRPPAAAALLPDQDARAAWRRRVAYAGSLFQLAFAALWLVRGTLATGWPARPIAIALAAAAAGVGIWGALATRGLAPQPRGQAAARLGRAITIATVAQLAASIALPFIVSALGRPDLAVTSIAITIGMLLLWLRASLASVGHLAAGVLLIAVPAGLALALTGNTLTAATGLATAAILLASAITGFRALASGTLTTPAPASHLPASVRWRVPPKRHPVLAGAGGRCRPAGAWSRQTRVMTASRCIPGRRQGDDGADD